MITDRGEYEFTTIDSSVMCDGGIMPLRQTDPSAGVAAKRCIRGEDIAFLHERQQEFRAASGLETSHLLVDRIIHGGDWRDVANVSSLVANVRAFTKVDVDHYTVPTVCREGVPPHWWEPDAGEGYRADLVHDVFGKNGLDPFDASDFEDVSADFSDGESMRQSSVESLFANYQMPKYYGHYTMCPWEIGGASWFSGISYEYAGPRSGFINIDDFLVHESGNFSTSGVQVSTSRFVRTGVSSGRIDGDFSARSVCAIGIFQIAENLWMDSQSLGEDFTITYPVGIENGVNGDLVLRNDIPAWVSALKDFWINVKGKQFYEFDDFSSLQQVQFRLCGVVVVNELRNKTRWW